LYSKLYNPRTTQQIDSNAVWANQLPVLLNNSVNNSTTT